MLPFGRIWYIYNLHYEKFADGSVKCIEDEIPFDLPDGWAWCRLKDLFNVCSAKRVLQSEWRKEGIPFYRAREIVKLSSNGYVDNDLFISLDHYEKLKTTYGVPQVGDLMVTGVGTIGKVYIVRENDTFYYKDASVLCFENRYGAIESEYARIMIDSPLLQEQIHSKTYGNTVDTITISTANDYLCVLPPINEQRKIIDAVKNILEITTLIEDGNAEIKSCVIQAKSKILDLAIRGKLLPQNPDDEPASVLLERIRAEKEELIRQGKIKRDKKESVIFKGEDNSYYEKIGEKVICIDDELPFEIPESWSWTRFGNIVFNYDSQRRPITKHNRVNDLGLYDYYGATGAIDKVDSYIFDGEYLMIGEDGGNFFTQRDNSFIASGRFWANNHVHIVQPVVCDIWYLKHFLDSCDLALMGLITGIGVPKLNQENMNKILVPIPPIEEQDRIAFKVKEIYSVLSNVEKSLD